MNHNGAMPTRKINYKWTIVMTALLAAAMFASCGGENGKALFKTAANPAIAYRSYLLEIRAQAPLSTQKLASELRC